LARDAHTHGATLTGDNFMDHSAYSHADLDRFRGWLDAAIEQAEKSWNEGGIPIGSVLIEPAGNGGRGRIVARGHNERVQSSRRAGDPSKGDPTAHAEVMCFRNAGRRRDWNKLALVSTLSPCPMCSGTSILFKIPRVIVGENRTYLGAEQWMKAQSIEVIVLDDPRCVALMERLQREKPDLWAEDIGL
jgi:creatinine deaminase